MRRPRPGIRVTTTQGQAPAVDAKPQQCASASAVTVQASGTDHPAHEVIATRE
jgi:hypothetical protein